jgi:hypothetical protein
VTGKRILATRNFLSSLSIFILGLARTKIKKKVIPGQNPNKKERGKKETVIRMLTSHI